MIIENKYNIGQLVYVRTDEENKPRLITAVLLRGNGGLVYEASGDGSSRWYYDFELTTEKYEQIESKKDNKN
jgi:hypothetical protein